MKHLLIISTICIVFFNSCKKDITDTSSNIQSNNSSNYNYPLAKGNYWIYSEIIIDSLGNQTTTGNIDSVYIDKDTIINGATYYRLFYKDIYSGQGNYSYVRDSSSLRVNVSLNMDSAGQTIIYYGMGKLFNNSIGDTLIIYTDPFNTHTRYTLVTAPPLSITLPAGTFANLYSERSDIYFISPFTTAYNPLREIQNFDKNVGMLNYQYHYSSAPWNTIERRLTRYHIN